MRENINQRKIILWENRSGRMGKSQDRRYYGLNVNMLGMDSSFMAILISQDEYRF